VFSFYAWCLRRRQAIALLDAADADVRAEGRPDRRAGRAARAHRGCPRTHPGLPPPRTRPGPAEITTLRRLVDDGTSVTQAARTLKISTAYAALASTR
jgi:hypothetical protein